MRRCVQGDLSIQFKQFKTRHRWTFVEMLAGWCGSGRGVVSPACRSMDGAMYWLMLLAGVASPIVTSAQSRFQDLEPNYEHGYEHPGPERTDWPWMVPDRTPSFDGDNSGPASSTPWTERTPATEATPEYRFRGDPPPTAGGTRPGDSDSELRFRPLTPGERERVGPTTRWRPTDEERRRDPSETPEPATLFDTLAPGRPSPPGPWDWPR